ncbi:MAG: pectate lyase [Candidatus Hydrogenedentes bacterium]|nr:pectate lyase [Candidatus Hydrogenedentota bacterium]
MMSGKLPVWLCVVAVLCCGGVWADQLAFPGAEGLGAYAQGGRGGDVYTVTNLNDSGAGSLREGIESATGPRTIVFAVSGLIKLDSSLCVDKPYITIAGQTAPGDGICFRDYPFRVQADHVIVRFIRSRLGDKSGQEQDSIDVDSGSNIIIDHCSASWSVDETLSCQNSTTRNLTVQWCLVSESLKNSFHHKGPHGYGGIIGSRSQTFHHNLYAHHSSRSPKVTGRRHCEVDFRNNVIYNWGYNNCYDGTSSYLNWVDNYYKPGPSTKSKVAHQVFDLSDEDISAGGSNSPQDSQNYETSLYAAGNYLYGYPEVTADNWNGGIKFANGATEEKNRAYTPHKFPAITEQTAEEAYDSILPYVGASLVRDSVDTRIVNDVINGTGSIIDSQDEVGGWPEYKSTAAPIDTDRDGMPDAWETAKGLNPNDSADRNDFDFDPGYTNLEIYLNELAAPAWGDSIAPSPAPMASWVYPFFCRCFRTRTVRAGSCTGWAVESHTVSGAYAGSDYATQNAVIFRIVSTRDSISS